MKPNLGGLKGVAACLLVLAACNPVEKAAGEPASPTPEDRSGAAAASESAAPVSVATERVAPPVTADELAPPAPQPERSTPAPTPEQTAVPPSPAPVRVMTQLPDGPGRDVVQRVCTGCHGADAFTTQGHDEAGWQTIIVQMQNLGMSAGDEDLAVVRAYLARELPPR